MLSKSKTKTQKLAAEIAAKIIKTGPRRSGAVVIALQGDLGAGKTTFTQGFLKALGVKHHVTSPTFVIFRKYPIHSKFIIHNSSFRFTYHFDLYRIHNAKELVALDFEEIISNPENIVLIEWPERIGKKLSRNAIRIDLAHGKNEKERIIKIKN